MAQLSLKIQSCFAGSKDLLPTFLGLATATVNDQLISQSLQDAI
jgi:hypothetical protein